MSCIITITGALGSGKSTIAGILCEKLGFERYSTGQAQRKIAEKYGLQNALITDYSVLG